MAGTTLPGLPQAHSMHQAPTALSSLALVSETGQAASSLLAVPCYCLIFFPSGNMNKNLFIPDITLTTDQRNHSIQVYPREPMSLFGLLTAQVIQAAVTLIAHHSVGYRLLEVAWSSLHNLLAELPPSIPCCVS